ncbi:hypothetical protein KPP03845_106414 [Streptomyces xanthophaeus]|uniref:hypothetical protein n=1 Tax=Streptomyces xanthophaeus TaxID=67385 RepID=UPI00233F5E02|nr:hypothetical protein [Streptomyces xanthophaeus]WCD89990.1 hypothetical protein KPP03845_106414 [Streptomyces xanthophaeus]
MRYNRAVRDLIAGAKAEPGFLVSHELGLGGGHAAPLRDHPPRPASWRKRADADFR